MHCIYISLGSNIEPEANIPSALSALADTFKVSSVSPVYRSPAVGMEGDDFLNAAVGAETTDPIDDVVQKLRHIEDQHGRNRTESRFTSRSLDLDLLLFDDAVINEADIQLPRSDITEFAFVLKPLVDIAAQLIHPVSGESMATLYETMCQQFPDKVGQLELVSPKIEKV